MLNPYALHVLAAIAASLLLPRYVHDKPTDGPYPLTRGARLASMAIVLGYAVAPTFTGKACIVLDAVLAVPFGIRLWNDCADLLRRRAPRGLPLAVVAFGLLGLATQAACNSEAPVDPCKYRFCGDGGPVGDAGTGGSTTSTSEITGTTSTSTTTTTLIGDASTDSDAGGDGGTGLLYPCPGPGSVCEAVGGQHGVCDVNNACCFGCIADGLVCEPGDTPSACGSDATCMTCSAGQQCVQGVCK
jgi:hypothetical protein